MQHVHRRSVGGVVEEMLHAILKVPDVSEW
jgi:hypothetical protein